MSFDNNYPNRKDHRKPYNDCRAVDRSTRNHGSDGWTVNNRTFDLIKKYAIAQNELRTSLEEGSE